METFRRNTFCSSHQIVLKQIECTKKNIFLWLATEAYFFIQRFVPAVGGKATALYTILYTILYEQAKPTYLFDWALRNESAESICAYET